MHSSSLSASWDVIKSWIMQDTEKNAFSHQVRAQETLQYSGLLETGILLQGRTIIAPI